MLATTVVVGTTFGIVARQSGRDPLETVGMSLIVFAGAAQFAMLQLFAAGAALPLVIGTVLLINARHLLMAASLRPRLGRLPLVSRLAAAYVLTDESFAMATGWYRRGGTGTGYYDFAITATFIGIVVLAVRRGSDVVVALAAAAVASALALAGASSVAVVTAGALAPLIAAARR